MRNELTQGLFRMSAILYARNDTSIISTKQIIRKIIEDALFQNSTVESMSLPSLIQYVDDNYAITLSEDEILSILKDEKFTDIFDYYYPDNPANDGLQISLKQKRKKILERESKKKNLHDYIIEFINIEGLDNTKIDVFYRFLYGVFTTNLEGYKQLLQEKNLIFKNDDDSFSEEDKKIINRFLDWDNSGKNAAVYNLASYAIEYCLLTNKKGTNLDVNNLKNKCLYLDTNILFRAIGVNGNDRRLRTEQFLSQFAKVQQKLFITKETDVEFKETLEFYTEKILNSTKPTGRVNPKVYYETAEIDGFFKYYFKWKINRKNSSVETFKVFLLAKYDDLLKRYNIDKESIKPYDEDEQIEKIRDYASAIRACDEEKSYSAAEVDARNILWMEHKRNGKNDDLYQVKHFFVSSDQHLRRWDYTRNYNEVPIVMLPSQWLSLILRYMERTDNDYKSFVYFLNMKVAHPSLSEEQLLYIIEGISEVVSDVTQQSNLVRTFIKEDFNKMMQGFSNEKIQESAKTFAETEYEKRLKDKGGKIEKLKIENAEKDKRILELEQAHRSSNEKIDDLSYKLSGMKEELERRKDYDSLKNESENNKLIGWKKKWLIPLIVLFLIWLFSLLLCFFAIDWDYNYSTKILNWIAGLDENRREIAKWSIYGFYILVGVCLFYSIGSVFLVKSYDGRKGWFVKLFNVIMSRLER